jgi:hypothetical protein
MFDSMICKFAKIRVFWVISHFTCMVAICRFCIFFRYLAIAKYRGGVSAGTLLCVFGLSERCVTSFSMSLADWCVRSGYDSWPTRDHTFLLPDLTSSSGLCMSACTLLVTLIVI